MMPLISTSLFSDGHDHIDHDSKPYVVFVLTNHGVLGHTDELTGYWLSEGTHTILKHDKNLKKPNNEKQPMI